ARFAVALDRRVVEDTAGREDWASEALVKVDRVPPALARHLVDLVGRGKDPADAEVTEETNAEHEIKVGGSKGDRAEKGHALLRRERERRPVEHLERRRGRPVVADLRPVKAAQHP